MELTAATLAERPDLIGQVWAMPDTWPEFMDHDPIGESLFGSVVRFHRELCVVLLDASERIVAHGTAMAFRMDADGRRELPARGWDQALVWAQQDLVRGIEPDTACALEVSVHRDLLGTGLSRRTFAALRDAARVAGYSTLLAPVRPTAKHLDPDAPMSDYAYRTRDDGLPVDPWLRTHVRLGGVIEGIAPASQTVSGTLAQWHEWTEVDFSSAGPVRIPLGLVPVQCLPEHDVAVYIEPNVWVRHDLA